MKVGWVFPKNKRCGISFYSHKYIDVLEGLVDVVAVDISEIPADQNCFSLLNSCDIVHIQYETSLFVRGKDVKYDEVCSRITVPVVVTLHEIYRRFPGVFPREELQGNWIIKWLKQLLYDYRHPLQTAFREHRAANFYARSLLVHSRFQKEILIEKGAGAHLIRVIPYPVQQQIQRGIFSCDKSGPLRLVSTGFINPNFNYELLFKVLEGLGEKWTFTWIGGVRREEDRGLLEHLNSEIACRHWQDQFTVTGWISDEERDRLMKEAHIYCAFFKTRSSSESLATAIGMKKMIIAVRLEFIEEIIQRYPLCVVVNNDSNEIIKEIKHVVVDRDFREEKFEALNEYNKAFSYPSMARTLVSHYESIIGS
ncbi:MAG: hypothetical protein GF401_07295 [Chitinivibrionales bacterium]|nr:hypothetical protein [Chitinivibrionales bacterium]